MIPTAPNVDEIYKTLENILKNKDKIQEIGLQSRKYIEEHHDCIKIAEKYLKAWES